MVARFVEFGGIVDCQLSSHKNHHIRLYFVHVATFDSTPGDGIC